MTKSAITELATVYRMGKPTRYIGVGIGESGYDFIVFERDESGQPAGIIDRVSFEEALATAQAVAAGASAALTGPRNISRLAIVLIGSAKLMAFAGGIHPKGNDVSVLEGAE